MSFVPAKRYKLLILEAMALFLYPASHEVLSLSKPSNTPEKGFGTCLEDSPLDTELCANAFLGLLTDGWSEPALDSAEQIMAVEIPSTEPSVVTGPETIQNTNKLGTAVPLNPALGQVFSNTEPPANAADGTMTLDEEVESSATLPAQYPAALRSPDDLADTTYDQDQETNKDELEAVRGSEPEGRAREQASSPSVSKSDIAEDHVQQEDESTVSQFTSSRRTNPELDSNHREQVKPEAQFVRCEVGIIIDSEVIDEELQYIVWLTKEGEPSCVPADDMDDCDELLAEYHNEHRDRPGFEWAASRMMPGKQPSEDMFKQWLHSHMASLITVSHSPSVSDKPTAHSDARRSPRTPAQSKVNQYRMDKHPIDEFVSKTRAVHKRKRGYKDGAMKGKRLRMA